MPLVSYGDCLISINTGLIAQIDRNDWKENYSGPESLDELNASLLTYLMNGDPVNSRITAETLSLKVRSAGNVYTEPLSTANYLLGVYSLQQKKYSEAIKYLEATAAFKESQKESDERYAKTLYKTSGL
jgi:hypothetical protein